MQFFKPRAVIVEAIQVTGETLPQLEKRLQFTLWSRPPMRAITGIEFKQGGVLPTIVPFGYWIVFPPSADPYPISNTEFVEVFQPIPKD